MIIMFKWEYILTFSEARKPLLGAASLGFDAVVNGDSSCFTNTGVVNGDTFLFTFTACFCSTSFTDTLRTQRKVSNDNTCTTQCRVLPWKFENWLLWLSAHAQARNTVVCQCVFGRYVVTQVQFKLIVSAVHE